MATVSSRRASRRGPARLVSAGLVAAIGALVGACTFGLGDYTAKPDRPDARGPGVTVVPPGEDAESPDGATPEEPPPGEELDSGPLQPPAEGGTCTDNIVAACTGPNGGDSGVCVGERRCVRGVWSDCKLPLKCPAAWSNPGPTCQNLDVKGDSDKWTDSPTVGPPVTLWALSRRTPFELYGLEDSFCFTPKQQGGCYATSTIAVSVECAGAQRKLSGNDFESRTGEICVKNAGASCVILDTHGGGGQWQSAGAVRCQRWFEGAHWRVQAEPRCSW